MRRLHRPPLSRARRPHPRTRDHTSRSRRHDLAQCHHAPLEPRPGTAPVLGRADGNLANFLWDGTRIRIADFEESGRSDTSFELAELAEAATRQDLGTARDHPVIGVRGGGTGHVPVAGLACYRPGHRSRLICRLHPRRGRKGETKAFT